MLVHGLWMHALAMRPLGRRLERTRGFSSIGFSYPSVRRTLDENADALRAACERIPGSTLHFVGHSLGGIVILRMMRRHGWTRPGRVVALGSPFLGSAIALRRSERPFGRRIVGPGLAEAARGSEAIPWTGPQEIGVIAGTTPFGHRTAARAHHDAARRNGHGRGDAPSRCRRPSRRARHAHRAPVFARGGPTGLRVPRARTVRQLDPLTHSLVGATIARTRLAEGRRLATAALVLAANAPDIDVLSTFFGSDAALGFRRGWTHGPLAILVLPVLVTALVLAWDRSRRRRHPELAPPDARRLLALAYLGCLTHPLLDWLNTYGVRLLMPFDDRWFYGDALFIVDPWLWLVLGGALFLGARRARFPGGWVILGCATSVVVLRAGAIVPLASRIAWVIGLAVIVVLRRTTPRSRPSVLATAALGLSVSYVGAMLAANTAGRIRVERELGRSGTAQFERRMVAPRPANPFVWDVVVDLGDRYRRGTLRWLPRANVAFEPSPILAPQPSPILDAARAAQEVRGTLHWMRFPYAEIEETPGGWTVWFLDARYARSRSDGFGTAVVTIPRERIARPDH